MGIVDESYVRLLSWIEKEGRTGWDPYDGLNTRHKILISTKIARLFCQYFHKFSPINLRPAFGVKKTRQLQAEAFIGLSLLRHPGGSSRTRIVEEIINELKNASMREIYGYHCWDPHGFPIQMLGALTPAGTTDVVGNEICGRLLHEFGLKHRDETAKEMAWNVAEHMIDKHLVEREDVAFFKYKPITPGWFCTYNASLLAAAYVMDMELQRGGCRHRKVLEKCFRFVCKMQKPEGYWCYSINFKSGEEKHQIDFHQGFILDCLLRYMEVNGFDEPFLSAYERGLRFYCEKQFLPTGQGLYRWPRKWPVNIHNQAQGIITFSRASSVDPNHLGFARTITEWTIRNMQDRNGYFYYLKYPFFTNKIPYIRWSDAAMAYALAVYLGIDNTSCMVGKPSVEDQGQCRE